MKYEIDRRYPFEATADSVCPVPDGTKVTIWLESDVSITRVAKSCSWHDQVHVDAITHFLVHKYPPEKHTAWLNAYPDGSYAPHDTEEDAGRHAAGDRLACIKIKWTEGEGL